MPLPAIDEAVVVADFDTELVVLVPARRKAHLLEPRWALLFDSCRRGDDVEALMSEVVAATGEDPQVTRTWLEHALAEFARLGVTAS